MTDSELDRCMRLYYSGVYSVALCYCKDPGDAYDITQEVFLKLYTYSGTFNEEEHIKAWLFRCAINKSKDMLKSHWHRYSLPLEAAAESTVNNGSSGEPFADPDTADRLAPFLKRISRNSRIALYLHYYEGYSVDEIAQISGVSSAAVRSRLLRGKNKLKKLLENEGN